MIKTKSILGCSYRILSNKCSTFNQCVTDDEKTAQVKIKQIKNMKIYTYNSQNILEDYKLDQ